MKDDSGISEVFDQTLLLALVVITAGLVGVMAFGFVMPFEKTAYVVPRFAVADVEGKTVITAFSRGGDPLYFNTTPLANYKAAFYVDTSAGNFRVVPVAGLEVFRPGDMVYLFYTGTGFYAVDHPPAGGSVVTLPPGRVTVRLVDVSSGVLIAQETVVEGPVVTGVTTATPAPTGTPTATVTPTPTATATTVTTTTATATPTATATTPPAYFTISVSWSPKGSGGNPTGSITPPGVNDATVTVANGGSQTFTITPAAGYRVRSISLDGSQVGGPGSVGQTLTYTLTNVQANHSLTVMFGN
ncbi:MAG TPA: hypothetical protein HA272_06750 [Methanoregula sp.]|nr:hypothetical protein [Methanoregula sp.]